MIVLVRTHIGDIESRRRPGVALCYLDLCIHWSRDHRLVAKSCSPTFAVRSFVSRHAGANVAAVSLCANPAITAGVWVTSVLLCATKTVPVSTVCDQSGEALVWKMSLTSLPLVKAGLHVRRKHKNKHKRKHKPRVNRDDANTSARKRNACLCLCLRRPGSHVAYACACVVRVNQPLAFAAIAL